MTEIRKDGNSGLINSVRFQGIHTPHDFIPKTEPVALAGYVSGIAEKIVITADPENEIDEIYEGNNSVEIRVSANSSESKNVQ